MSRRYLNVPRTHSRYMEPLPEPSWAEYAGHISSAILAVWHSREFLAIHYRDDRGERLSVNRTSLDLETGRFRDGITWDELQRVKNQCGLRDRWCVEIYPPADDMVDVAAMRHLWLLDTPPAYGWDRDNQ